MSKTSRVCVQTVKGRLLHPYDVYIGRRCTRSGYDLPQSHFANKFTGERCVYQYYKWIMKDEQKELRGRAVEELSGLVIACFCSKEKGNVSCHGDVLLFLCNGEMTEELAEIIEREERILRDIEDDKKAWTVTYANIKPLSVEDRIVGMFSALFLGDSLGAKFERSPFKGRTLNLELKESRISRNSYTGEKRQLSAGSVTDDSEMTIILADHLTGGEIDAPTLAKEYIAWSNSGQPAQGKNTLDLFNGVKTLKGFETRFEKKFGFLPSLNDEPSQTSDAAENQLSNGTLMRCCSLALLKNNALIYRDIYLSNPSIAVEEMESDYLDAIRMALEGFTPREILNYLLRNTKNRSPEYKSVVSDIIKGKKRTLRNTDTEGKGSISSAMYATLYCLQWLATGVKPFSRERDIEPTLMNMYASLIVDYPGSDTDSNMAVMGALCGAIFGIKELEKDKVFAANMEQIYDYEAHSERPRPWQYHPVKMIFLYPKLFALYHKEKEKK
jgi:hypothetical protein